MKSQKTGFYLLLLIILLAIFLRLYLLGEKSLTFDESFYPSERVNKLPFWELEINFAPHPPLWPVLTYWLTNYTLEEFWLRLPSALFGILTVVFIYLTAKTLFNEKIALLSSLLMAISPLNVFISQEMKPYALFSLLFIASFYFFIKVLKENKPVYWFLFVVFTSLTAYTHWYTFVYILILNLFFFINLKEHKKMLSKWIYSQLALFILLIPLAIYSLIQPHINLGKMTFKSMLLTLPYLFHGFSFGEVSPYLLGYNLNLKYVFFYLAFLSIFIYLFIRGLKLRKENYLLLAILMPVALFIFSFLIPLQVVPKRASFALFAFYIVIANGLFTIKNRKLFNTLIALLVLSSFISLVYYYSHDFEDWRSASAFVSSNFEEGDIIGFMSSQMDITLKYYLFKSDVQLPMQGIPNNSSFTNKALKIRSEDIPTKVTEENVKNVDNFVEGYKRLWLIQTREDNAFADPKGLVKQNLDEKYTLLLNKNFSGGAIKIYLYKLV